MMTLRRRRWIGLAGGAAGMLVLGCLLGAVLLVLSQLFPQTVVIQSSTHILAFISNAPAAGSSIRWCTKQPRPFTLRNGEIVLAHHCQPLGWSPF